MAAELQPNPEFDVCLPLEGKPSTRANFILKGDIPGESGLPPREFWLVNPKTEKIDTPVDERGLVDVTALIRGVKSTIDPEYEWPRHLSVHHFYWKGYWYDSVFAGQNAKRFRELPIHKGLLPRVFENWLHALTIPTDVPAEEVQQYRIEGWEIAKNLFHNVRGAAQWEKRAKARVRQLQLRPETLPTEFNGEDIYGKAIIRGILDKHFSGIEHNLVRLERLPEEFRLIEPTDSRENMGRRLGQLVVPRALPLVNAVAA